MSSLAFLVTELQVCGVSYLAYPETEDEVVSR